MNLSTANREMKNPSVFLSHSWNDEFFTRRLAETLQDAGVYVWIDEAELRVGDSLISKISDAIDQTDYVVAVLSQNSVNSNWVKKELELAMTEEINGKRVKVLPILIEECEIPLYLRDKVYADFTNANDPDEFKRSLSKLLNAFIRQFQETVTISDKTTVRALITSTRPTGLEHFEDILTITGLTNMAV